MFVACTLWNKQGIAVRPLPQRILIQRRGGLFYQTAEWVALVTVSSPTPTKILWNFTTTLEAEITKVRTRFPDLADNWAHRLAICRDYLQHFHLKRQKRAPLGFIGKLSHTLFGTVTEEELNQYRQIILQNQNSVNRTIHRVNLLLSATKTNRNQINSNSLHINKLQRYLTSLQHSILRNFGITSDSLQMLNIKLKIEHSLASLEQNIHRLLVQFNLRRRQISSLYHRSLSEDLLDPAELQHILKQAQSRRFYTMPAHWYYENCIVLPVWVSLEEITFKIRIPLHDGRNYILYSLKSFPFPVRSGYDSKLLVKESVAYSSSSGLLFEPILCAGDSLKICRGGPLYESTRFRCERALISRNTEEVKDCHVQLSPSNQTMIKEPTPGLYVVSTPKISTRLHCDAQSEQIINLSAGVYIISINNTCTLRGQGWTLTGLNRFTTPFHIKNQVAPLSLRTIFAPFPPKLLDQIAAVPKWTPIRQLPSISLQPLSNPVTWMSLPTIGTATWINSSSILLIIIIIVVLVLAKKYCRNIHALPAFRKKKTPSAPMDLQERTTMSQDETPTIRLYPDLRSENQNGPLC